MRGGREVTDRVLMARVEDPVAVTEDPPGRR